MNIFLIIAYNIYFIDVIFTMITSMILCSAYKRVIKRDSMFLKSGNVFMMVSAVSFSCIFLKFTFIYMFDDNFFFSVQFALSLFYIVITIMTVNYYSLSWKKKAIMAANAAVSIIVFLSNKLYLPYIDLVSKNSFIRLFDYFPIPYIHFIIILENIGLLTVLLYINYLKYNPEPDGSPYRAIKRSKHE